MPPRAPVPQPREAADADSELTSAEPGFRIADAGRQDVRQMQPGFQHAELFPAPTEERVRLGLSPQEGVAVVHRCIPYWDRWGEIIDAPTGRPHQSLFGPIRPDFRKGTARGIFGIRTKQGQQALFWHFQQ